jgi:hypothetical protein
MNFSTPRMRTFKFGSGKKDRPVDVAAYSSAATAVEDERDRQGGRDTGRAD